MSKKSTIKFVPSVYGSGSEGQNHSDRDGKYYVLSVQTTYSKSGGQRQVSIGKKNADL